MSCLRLLQFGTFWEIFCQPNVFLFINGFVSIHKQYLDLKIRTIFLFSLSGRGDGGVQLWLEGHGPQLGAR
jgi:hypothetical protein